MVGTDAHGDVGLLVVAVAFAAFGSDFLNEGLEDVGVVVGAFALHDHAEALEAHAGIDVLGFQGFKGAVGFAVELHEDEVPDFDDLGVVLVDEVFAGHFGFFLVGTNVDMDFGAGTAGTLVAHFPEVVFL